ncbi:hypothetical protein [Paenibacillus kandeliae]|uniref:hypothetical protein n=1 Tax=Paenibacillus kandeliae TaxID=3231269 RepID=UPI0034584AD7
MEENTSKAITLAITILVMVGILSYLLISLQIQDRMVYTVSQWTENSDHRIAQTYELVKQETYTGAQVQQSLNNILQLDADIEVNGRLYPRNNKVESSDVQSIDIHKTYIVQYRWDSNGIITKIIFT